MHISQKWLFFLFLLHAFPLSLSAEEGYRRAVSDQENVKLKLFPKSSKFEISGPAVGTILNPSFINSYLFRMGLNYYPAETWGFGGEFLYFNNSDKAERDCLETFYNDPTDSLGVTCASGLSDKNSPLFDNKGKAKNGVNFGPAYMAIREINYMMLGTFTWSPVYGKQLAFLSSTSYFDLFFTTGLGLSFSTYYPKSLYLRNGTLSRGPIPTNLPSGCPSTPGVCPSNKNVDQLIGINGRPDPSSDTSVTATFGVGQKWHFAERFHIEAEARNYTLLGTELGYEMYYALWVGAGYRF